MALPLLTRCIFGCVYVFDVQGIGTALVYAARGGHRDVAEFLVAHGANVNGEGGVGDIFAIDGPPVAYSVYICTLCMCV